MHLTRYGGAVIACVGLLWSAAPAADSPAANSEVLTTDTQVAADGSSVETIHLEKHAANDAGALIASRAALPFNARMQELEIVEAHTLKKDGTVVPVDLSSVFEQLSKEAGVFATYADLRTKVILFPQFAAGDTAVFTAKLKTPHPFFDGQFMQGGVFPRSSGFVDVRETITVPKSMTLHVENHDVEFSKRDEGGNVVYSWHHVQAEAKPAAPAIVSAIDREPRFFVSTFKDYAELGRAYGRFAEPKIAVTPKIRALADQITANETDRREQARKIFEWVSRNIRYVAIELGRGSLEPHDVDFILANGYGDCKDHDTLLRTLLKAKNIASASILINSGNAYSLTDVPSFMQLNHVITYLPDFDVYLDSSFSMAPFGILPMGEYGKPAIRVSAGGAAQFTMPVLPAGLSRVSTTVNESVDAAGLVTGTSTTTAAGPSSIILRVEGLALQTLGPEKAADIPLVLRGFKDAKGTANIGSPMQLAPGYSISTTISAPGWADWLAGVARRTLPGAATVLTAEPAMGPLYLTTSDSEPTPCSSVHMTEDVSVALPANVTPVHVPDEVHLSSPNIAFSARWSLSGGTLSLHRDYTSKFDQPLCTGRLRVQTAEVLKKINESYQIGIQLHRGSNAPPPAPVAQGGPPGGDASALLQQAAAQYEAGRYDDAANAYEGAVKLGAIAQNALSGLCQSLARSDRFGEADEACSRALASAPDDAEELESRGLSYFRQGKYSEALADFDRALASHPNGARFLYERGLAKRKMGDEAGARRDMEKARQMNPQVLMKLPPKMAG